MAGEGIVSQGEVKNYDRKITILVLMTCLVAVTGGFVLGYDRGISGGVASMDTFLRDFFPSVYEKQHDMTGHENRYCKYDSQLLTSFTSSLYLAAFVASFCAPATTRVFGRKISMTVGSGVFLIGSILTAAAVNVEMLIIGRILLGIGVGYANQSVPVYLSEMAPAKARRALNMVFQWAINIGILVANLVNYGTNGIDGAYGWRVSLSLAAVPAIIMTVSAIFLPDTPNSLIERGHNDKAKNILQKVHGTEYVEEEFLELLEASENSKSIEHMHPWRNILQPRYRPQLIMSIAIPFFQQLTGVNVVMFYAPVLFKTIGMAVYSSLMSAVILGQVNMLATFVFISCDDKLSRRFLFLQGGIQMFICQIIVGVILGQKFGVSGEGTMSKDYFLTILFLICVYVAGFAWSRGPLGWVVPIETFPLEIRSAGQSINVSANMFFTFIIAHAFPSMLCHMKFGIFFFFGGFMFLMTLFIYFFLPETMNIPIEEMNMVWKKHWFWERYYRENWKLKGPLPVDIGQQLQWEPSSRLNFTLFCCDPRSENELRVFFRQIPLQNE